MAGLEHKFSPLLQKTSPANKGHKTKSTEDIKAENLYGSTSSLRFQRNGI